MQGMDKKMTIMLGARWKRPTLKTLFVWAFKVLNASAISNAKTTLVLCFSDLVFVMKSTRTMIHPKFLLLAKLSRLFLFNTIYIYPQKKTKSSQERPFAQWDQGFSSFLHLSYPGKKTTLFFNFLLLCHVVNLSTSS